MINIPNVTLVAIDCVDPKGAMASLKYSMRGINFRDVFLFTSDPFVNPEKGIQVWGIDKMDGLSDYSDFVLHLIQKVDSDYVLIVQSDGFVINPGNWDPKFLEYDYIGSPWPADPAWADKQTARAEIHRIFPYNRVGNGGFSLRSRKFMEISNRFITAGIYGEDCYLCTIHYDYMVKNGIRFAPFDLALRFSYENPLPEMEYPNRLNPDLHFGFHGRQLNNSEEIINMKNIVA